MKKRRRMDPEDPSEEGFSLTDFLFIIGFSGMALGAILAFDTILSIRTNQFPEYYLRPGLGSVVSLLRALASHTFFRYAFALFTIGFISTMIALVRRHMSKTLEQ